MNAFDQEVPEPRFALDDQQVHGLPAAPVVLGAPSPASGGRPAWMVNVDDVFMGVDG